MLSLLKAGPYTIRGVSVAGIYTSLQVKELGVVLDLGLAPRGFCGTDQVFLSHAHVDHISGLAGLLGVRGMMRKSVPLRVYMPEEVVDDLREALAALGRLQHHALEFEAVGMAPGDECALPSGMLVRAFRFGTVADRPAMPVAHLTVRGRDGIWLTVEKR